MTAFSSRVEAAALGETDRGAASVDNAATESSYLGNRMQSRLSSMDSSEFQVLNPSMNEEGLCVRSEPSPDSSTTEQRATCR